MKYSLLLLGSLGLLSEGHAYKISAYQLSRLRNDGTEEESNIQIKNIYGIPSEQEKL